MLYDKIKEECAKRKISIRLLEEKTGLSNGVYIKVEILLTDTR